MLIRPFQLADHYNLIEMLQNMLSDECYRDTVHALTNQLSLDHELVLIAFVNHKIAGVIIGTIENNHGYYYRIAVESKYRDQGIGRALLESLKQKFIKRQVKKVMITLDVHNEVLIPYYETLGYQQSDFSRAPNRLSIVNHG